MIILIGLSQLVFTGCNQTEQDAKLVEKHNNNSPNILFIYTDDQAPWAAGFTGNPQAITPNMDKLATEGMMFTNAYTTTPVCSPSRIGLLTSRYGFETGIDDFINTKFSSLTRKEPDLGIKAEMETWPEVLQQAGYHTGLIGKWHLGYKKEHHPTLHGYNEFTGFVGGGAKPINPILEKKGVVSQHKGLTADLLANEAITFLEKNKDKKFALSLHFRAPHGRWLPVSEEDAAPYQGKEMEIPNPNYPDLNVRKAKRMMKEYLSSVRSVDRNVGNVLDTLDTLGLTDNTLVVFTSDHGYNMGHNGIYHKGNGHWLLNTPIDSGNKNIPLGQRPNMYDNSIKVPTIIKWPNVIKPNTTNLSTISNLDWFPTLVEIAKGKKSDNNSVRGQSFLKVLTGEKAITTTDYYAAYSTIHQSISGMRMYSDGQYKLIKDYVNKGNDEFYDLVNDPLESINLIATNQPKFQIIINRFDDVIFEKMLSTQDPLLKQFAPKVKTKTKKNSNKLAMENK